MSLNHKYLTKLLDSECPDSTARIFPALVYEKGKGSIVSCMDGKSYIDLSAGFSALALGHNHPEVISHVTEYLTNGGVMHGLGDVYSSKSKVEFISSLKNFLPSGFDKIALSITGGQAVELAIKTAILKTKKPGVISLKQGYHGLDLGAMVLTGMDKFRLPFKGWSGSDHVFHVSTGCDMSVLSDLLEENEIGQVVVEPVLGRYGNMVHKEGWLKELKTFCASQGLVLIFDEVFTGLGRTGVSFRATIDDCDIICMGKAIGGGMPISAIACSEDIMKAWPESLGEALHTGTFFGHPLSCEVGAKTLEIIARENLVERSMQIGNWALGYLREGLSEVKSVTDIRGQGLMIAIEFDKDLAGVTLMEALKEDGVVLIPSGNSGKSVSITPALNIPKETFKEALDKIILHSKRI